MGCQDLDPDLHADDEVPPHSESGRHLSALDDVGPPDLSGLICTKEGYSALAYLLLQSKEQAIKALFSKKMAPGQMLDIPSLFCCYVIVYGTTLLTFGAAIPV